MDIADNLANECLAYEWIKRLFRENVVQNVDQIVEITGYDLDLVGRVCVQLYNENCITPLWGIRRIQY